MALAKEREPLQVRTAFTPHTLSPSQLIHTPCNTLQWQAREGALSDYDDYGLVMKWEGDGRSGNDENDDDDGMVAVMMMTITMLIASR